MCLKPPLFTCRALNLTTLLITLLITLLFILFFSVLLTPAASEANPLQEELCEDGDGVMCHQLAADLFFSKHSADRMRSAELTLLACRLEVYDACYQQGLLHQEGTLLPSNLRASRRLFEIACDHGNLDACNSLGILLLSTTGGEPNPLKGEDLLSITCDGGLSSACFNLAKAYRQGLIPNEGAEKAWKPLLKACGEGHLRACDVACKDKVPLACQILGLAYESGEVVRADPTFAASLYLKACNGGEVVSCNNLGTMHQLGVGVPPNSVQAAILYSDACEGFSAQGCYNLAYLLDRGEGIEKDADRALILYQKSCDLGHQSACKFSK